MSVVARVFNENDESLDIIHNGRTLKFCCKCGRTCQIYKEITYNKPICLPCFMGMFDGLKQEME
jgi:hypothetical protein